MKYLKFLLLRVPKGIIPLIILVGIFYLTLASNPLGGMSIIHIPGLDKLEHFIMFATLTFFCLVDYERYIFPRHIRKNLMVAMSIAFIFIGGMTEVMQAFLTLTRNGDWGDFIADAIGVVSTMIAYYYYFSKWVRKGIKLYTRIYSK